MEQLIIVVILFIAIEAIGYFYQKQLDEIFFLRLFLWVGIFIHEFSHYIACKIFRAPVSEFKVGLREGHVQHGKSKIPLIGSFFISMAPIFIGITSLFGLFYWYFDISPSDFIDNIKFAFERFDLLTWQFWVWLFLSLNILATFVPSKQDFKNIAFILVLYIIASIFIPQMAMINTALSLALGFALILLIIAFAFLGIINLIKYIINKLQ